MPDTILMATIPAGILLGGLALYWLWINTKAKS